VLEKQTAVFGDGTDADVVAFADDDPRRPYRCSTCAAAVRGQRGWVVEAR
jgi:excinuclease ABC subunit C